MFTINEEGIFRGTVQFLNALINTQAIEDKHVKDLTGVQASKLEHQHREMYSQGSTATITAGREIIHVVKGNTASVETVKFGIVGSWTGAVTANVDILANGTTILSGPISASNTLTAYATATGSVLTAANTLTAGTVLEVQVTVSTAAGTIGTGLFGYVDLFEDAQ